MKLVWKIFFSTVSILAIVASFGGYFLISQNFKSSLDRELDRSFEDLLYVRFSYETALVNLAASSPEVTDARLATAADKLREDGLQRGYTVAVDNEDFLPVSGKKDWSFGRSLMQDVSGTERLYRVGEADGRVYLSNACRLTAGGRSVYLQISRDISELFEQKQQQIHALTITIILVLVLGGAGIFALSLFLTRPIRQLSAAANEIARGDYTGRIKIKDSGEIGELAENFNRMAQSVEEKVQELEEAARRQETFTADFAHELKTPLTSIIGYADVLRSRELEPEQQLQSANYIYSEGRRLESLSLKLMDLLVLKKQDFPLRRMEASFLLNNVAALFIPTAERAGVTLQTTAEQAMICVEPDLVRTMLLNLLDNARKASSQGERIEFCGAVRAEGYVVSVCDHGCGISKEELKRIEEPFYMVDQSRARRQHGAGLGLSLCSEIAKLHGSKLEFTSEPGRGTTVCIRFAFGEERSGEDEA